MSLKYIPIWFLTLWLFCQSLNMGMCWVYGVYSLYKNELATYQHLQQLSRHRAREMLFTVAALFCIVTTSKNFFSSRMPDSVPNASFMVDSGDPIGTLQNISKYPEMIWWFCYATTGHVLSYSLCSLLCTEGLYYYMSNIVNFQNILTFSTSKEPLDSSQEQEKEYSGLRLSASIHLGRTRVVTGQLQFGGQCPSLHSPS